jgi:hypothetical protein
MDMKKIAAPYIATAKPGDVLTYAPCDNPKNWWSVFRNGRPIYHFSDKADAEALCYVIAQGRS